MKLNLKQTFKTLKGEVVKSGDEVATLGEVLANCILMPHQNKKGFQPLRAWELAKKLNNLEEIELDNSEIIQIKEIVENNENYLPFVRGQVLEFIIEAEK